MDISRSRAPWTETGQQYFGHADLAHARSQGKSDAEILKWANANVDKLPGGKGKNSKVYKDLVAAAGRSSGSSRSRKSKLSPGSITSNSYTELPSGNFDAPGSEGDNSGSQMPAIGENGNPVFEIIGNPLYEIGPDGKLSVSNSASVDNSVSTQVGDNNTFGGNLDLGNNNAQTKIRQGLGFSEGNVLDLSAGMKVDNDANVSNRVNTGIGDGNTFGAGASIGNNNAVTSIGQGARSAKERAQNYLSSYLA